MIQIRGCAKTTAPGEHNCLEWRLEPEAFSRREIGSDDDVLDFFVGHFVDIDLTRQPSS
jgi:hypothetical protein